MKNELKNRRTQPKGRAGSAAGLAPRAGPTVAALAEGDAGTAVNRAGGWRGDTAPSSLSSTETRRGRWALPVTGGVLGALPLLKETAALSGQSGVGAGRLGRRDGVIEAGKDGGMQDPPGCSHLRPKRAAGAR